MNGQSADELAQAWSASMTERSRAVLRGQKALAVIMRRRMHEALAEAEEQHMANAWTDPRALGGRAAKFFRQAGIE